MPVFLNPGWLVGLAALALPLVIHLWNRRPRQTIRLGSLDFLVGRQAGASWGRRIDNLPLLLLRALLLTIVVAALARLAGPLKVPGPESQPGIVLVDPRLVDDSLALFANPVIDSLRRQGASLRLLSTDFPSLTEGSQVDLDSRDLWGALIQFDRATPLPSTVVVATIGLAGDWPGSRPTLRNHYRVVLIEAAKSIDTVRIDPGLLVRQIQTGALTFREPLPVAAPRSTAPPEPSGLVTIVADQNDDWEAAAWRAAAEAITLHLWGRKASVLVLQPGNRVESPDSISLTIWLSEMEPDSTDSQRIAAGGTMLRFPSQRSFEASDNTITEGLLAPLIPDALDISIRRLAPGAASDGVPLLLDGFGTPIISETRVGRGRVWRFLPCCLGWRGWP